MTTDELFRIYDDEFAHFEQLEDILGEERQALKSRDADAITAVTARKQALLEQIESLDIQRREFKEACRDIYIGDTELALQIQHRDDKLKASLENFQHHNRINMGILEMGRLFTENMLSILRGQPLGTGTYGPGGDRGKGPGPKSLAKV